MLRRGWLAGVGDQLHGGHEARGHECIPGVRGSAAEGAAGKDGSPDVRARSAAAVIVCLDVDYRADSVVAAAVGFAAWTDAAPALELVVKSDGAPAEYEPGQFYRRELPHLLAVLALVVPPPELIVVDGYVWLAPNRPGLGAHLYDAVN